jgi:hypothetical protein
MLPGIRFICFIGYQSRKTHYNQSLHMNYLADFVFEATG